ncbi:MAG: AAA family ATPase [Candidatus Obscuribacterales bacterium]|nr:AAA family ATPase [Candidatus Obscuribacterales bacterium]
MHLTRLAIKGFGLFGQRDFTIPPSGLTLIYGQNESGKSTLLAFVRAMMFEPQKKDLAPYTPPNTTDFAGTINLVNDKGKPLAITRRFGGKGAKKTDIFFDSRAIDLSRLEELFGGASKELFKNVYAFSLTELTQIEGLQQDQVTTALYGASVGAGISGLLRAKAELESNKRDIFLPAGTQPTLNQKLKELAALRERIQGALNSVATYELLELELREFETEVQTTTKLLDELSAMNSEIDTKLKNYPSWQRVCELRALIGESKIPDGFNLADFDSCKALNSTVIEIESRKAKTISELQGCARELLELKRQPSVLERAQPIKALHQRFAVFDSASERATLLDQRLSTLRQQQGLDLTELGIGWDVPRVFMALDSGPSIESVSEFEKQSAGLEASLSQTKQNGLALANQKSELQQKIEPKNAKLLEYQYEEHNVLLSELTYARNGLGKYRADHNAHQYKHLELEKIRAEILSVCERMENKLSGRTLPNVIQDYRKSVQSHEKLILPIRLEQFSKDQVLRIQHEHSSAEAKKESLQSEVSAAELQCIQKQQELNETSNAIACLPPESAASFENADEIAQSSVKMTTLLGSVKKLEDEQNALRKKLSESLGKVIDDSTIQSLHSFDMEGFKVTVDRLDKTMSQNRADLAERNRRIADVQAGANALRASLTAIPVTSETAVDVRQKISTIEEAQRQASAILKHVNLVAELESKVSKLSSRLSELEGDLKQVEQEKSTSASSFLIITGLLTVFGIAITYLVFAHYGATPAALSGGATLLITGFSFGLIKKNKGNEQIRNSRQTELRTSIEKIREEFRAAQAALKTATEQRNELHNPIGVETLSKQVIDDFIEKSRQEVDAAQQLEKELLSREATASQLAKQESLLIQEQNLLRTILVERDELECKWRSCCDIGCTQLSGSAFEVVDRARALTGLAGQLNTLQQKHEALIAEQTTVAQNQKLLLPDLISPLSAFNEISIEVTNWLTAYNNARSQQRGAIELQAKEKELNASLSALRQQLEAKTQLLTDSQEACTNSLIEWAQFLTNLGLPADLPFDVAKSIFAEIELLRIMLNDYAELLDGAANLAEVLKTYRSNVCRIQQLSSFANPAYTHETVAQAVMEFIDLIDRTEVTKSVNQNLKQEISSLQEQLANVCAAESANVKSMNQWLSEQSKLQLDWRAWLLSHQLDSTLEHREAVKVLGKLRAIENREGEIHKLGQDLSTERTILAEFEKSTLELAEALNLPQPPKTKIRETAQNLYSILVTAEKTEDEFQKLEERRLSLQQSAKDDESKIQQHKSAMEHILKSYGCGSLEDMNVISKRLTASEKHLSEMQGLVGNLCRILSAKDEKQLEDIFADFNKYESLTFLESREKEISALKKKLGSTGNKNDEESLTYKLARKRNEMETLINSRDLNKLRTQEQTLLTEIQQLSLDWIRLTMAESLLVRARKRFETESQPQVIAAASQIFSKITDGKYTRIQADSKAKTIDAITADHKPVSSTVLSTGAREQLYLALRFAFIQHRAASCEPLPVIMDDILVNFDYHRALRAIGAIQELSETHQVLFFSCHPATVAYFRQAVPDANIINLNNSSIDHVLAGYVNSLTQGSPLESTEQAPQPDESKSASNTSDMQRKRPTTSSVAVDIASNEFDRNASFSDDRRAPSAAAYRVASSSGASSPKPNTREDNPMAPDTSTEFVGDQSPIPCASPSDQADVPREHISLDTLELCLHTFRKLILQNLDQEVSLLKNLCNESINLIRRAERKFVKEETGFLRLRDLIHSQKFEEARTLLEDALDDDDEQRLEPADTLLELGVQLNFVSDYSSAVIVWRAAEEVTKYIPCPPFSEGSCAVA